MRNTLHTFENYKRILDLEERRGRLREDSFSEETRQLSARLKEARDILKVVDKNKKSKMLDAIGELKLSYEQSRIDDIKQLHHRIQKGDYRIELRTVNAKGKTGYTTANTESMILSKVLMLELKRSYKYQPANRNEIIEELRALLDTPMPKVLIRADIHHFFESISQDRLISKMLEDAYLSVSSLKTLKTFLYHYNELSLNLNKRLGVPRGLAFSSYLAEIYMASFDRKVRQIEGVYFYKRYVDDIILLAKPGIKEGQDYWKEIETLAGEIGLELNENEDKRSCELYYPASNPKTMNYLGYQFRYAKGNLEVLLTESKFKRYKESIRLIFDNYKGVASKSGRKKHPKVKKTDTTIQFMHRLSALTGNGHLNGRKNFVLVGIYYSNKYITNVEQLRQLDQYLEECVNNQELFCPPNTMFNYDTKANYDYCIRLLKRKIISEYSFVKGFETRRLYRWSDYTSIIRQISALYYGQEDE